MFTGIIESTGICLDRTPMGSGIAFKFSSPFSEELKVDQSVSHNGVCLTIESVSPEKDWYTVTAIEETLEKTNLGSLETGSAVNLERALLASGRFEGHIVQGHVDITGKVIQIEDQNGSWLIRFFYPEQYSNMLVEKGSITVNGVSLTVVEAERDFFSVAIIPYTYNHTTFHLLKVGDRVNLEFDILAKYYARIFSSH
jgi:riboflavin synthase